MQLNTILNEDCLEGMKRIPSGSVDMILCDLPYGTTACKWDVVIPFAPLWEQYERIIKPNGVIVLTASQPFTSALTMSNPPLFKYPLIWEKSRGSGVNAKSRPIQVHEDICVFYRQTGVYNPQKWTISERFIDRRKTFNPKSGSDKTKGRGLDVMRQKDDGSRMPVSVISIPNDGCRLHPTQKPVPLFEYLIKTYTNEGDVVLDNCMGSGTTAIACISTGRNYLGFEKDEQYFKVTTERIEKHKASLAEQLFI